jgi:hypothetical protein
MRETDKRMIDALGEENAVKYPSLNNNICIEKALAKNSAFYNTIMEDGYVFNPYIHRRWLPVQYEDLVAYARSYNYSMPVAIKDRYTYMYAIDFVLQEVRKLCTLSRYDKKAFEERSQFFTLDIVKKIIIEYIKWGMELIPASGKMTRINHISTPLGFLYKESYEQVNVLKRDEWFGSMRNTAMYDWSPAINRFEEMMSKIENSKTYFGIYKAIKGLEVRKGFEKHSPLIPNDFIEAFWKSGAYYTIKSKVMFQKGEVNGLKGNAACKEIHSMLIAGATAQDFHRIYESMK